MQNETTLKGSEDASHFHNVSRKTDPRAFCFAKLATGRVRLTGGLLECARVLAPLLLLVSSVLCGADDKQLWQIQKMLASKKYVDLTHEFAPGIPRWPGFAETLLVTPPAHEPPFASESTISNPKRKS